MSAISRRIDRLEGRAFKAPAEIQRPWLPLEQVRGTNLWRVAELPEELAERGNRDFTEEQIATELSGRRIIQICKSYDEDVDLDLN